MTEYANNGLIHEDETLYTVVLGSIPIRVGIINKNISP